MIAGSDDVKMRSEVVREFLDGCAANRAIELGIRKEEKAGERR